MMSLLGKFCTFFMQGGGKITGSLLYVVTDHNIVIPVGLGHLILGRAQTFFNCLIRVCTATAQPLLKNLSGWRLYK